MLFRYNGINLHDCIFDKKYKDKKSVIMTRYFILGYNIAQRIKGTLGITGLFFFRVLIDERVWHLDVGLSLPGAVGGSKGLTVRQLK